MANRLKEDEKNERIIRGLLKLQENRRCINCGSLGPQYVCTNFWTFVCTNCSGIHREFTHRVKSISMAKFTSQEVSALQEGGNQRAKEIYFKEWDPQRHSLPDSGNIDRLRDFIKHVYVDRRYSGERTYDKPPRGKMGDKDDFYENRRVDTYQGGSKSPPYEDAHERRYSDRSSPGGRSPGYDQESRQYGDYRRSPGLPPVINDWRREDRFGDRRSSDGDHKLEGQSPERAKDLDSSSSPVVRPVRDILGENVVPLRISEPPKTNSGKPADGSALTQRTASSSSLASSNGNAAEVKLETSKSLIDFDAEPEPPVAAAIPQAQQTTAVQSAVQPANSSDDNWASFDVAPAAKTTQGPSNLSPLDSILSQLSMPSPSPAPAPAPAQVSGVQGPLPVSAVTATAVGAGTLGNLLSVPPSGASVTPPGLMTAPSVNNAGQWASGQHNQPVFPATGIYPTTQQFIPSAGGSLNSQQWSVSPVPTMQGHPNKQMPQHPSIQMPHASSLISKPTNDISSGTASLPSKEVQPGGRQELPEDLFAARYSSFTSPAPGWQMGPPHGMGIYMQYHTAAPVPSFPHSSKSTNPFDASSEPPPVQAPTFPSMSSMQGALPSISPSSGVIQPPSMGNPSLSWSSPQSSYGSVLPPQAQVHAPAMAPRAYMGQQAPTNMPMPRHQEIGISGPQGAAFGISNPDQQITGMFSTSSAAASSFSTGGNPFG